MTQPEARNAVNRIKLKVTRLLHDIDDYNEIPTEDILNDLIQLEQSLSIRHFIHAPNCRPATADELQQLCAASNVVMFPPAA